jgi:hypothetical protein
LAQGLLPDGAPYGADAIYGCWLLFHLCMLPLFPIRTQLMLPFDEVTQNQATSLRAESALPNTELYEWHAPSIVRCRWKSQNGSEKGRRGFFICR